MLFTADGPYHYNSTSIATLAGAHSCEHSYLHKSELAVYNIKVVKGYFLW